MEGKKEFFNASCVNLKVVLTVRAGDQTGCVYKIEEFCLACYESKVICYGNPNNPFLDGIRACSNDGGQYAEVDLQVNKCGCTLDKLLNKHNKIIFLSAGPALAVTSAHCKL